MQHTNKDTRATATAMPISQPSGSGIHAKASGQSGLQPAQSAVKLATSSPANKLGVLADYSAAMPRRALQTLDSNRTVPLLPSAPAAVKENAGKTSYSYVSRYFRPPASSTTQPIATTNPTPTTGFKRKYADGVAVYSPATPTVQPASTEADDEAAQRENIAWLDMMVALMERKYKNHQHPVCIDDLMDAKMLKVFNKDQSVKASTELPARIDSATKRSRLSLEQTHATVPINHDTDDRRMQALKRHAQQIQDTSVSSTTCCGCKTGCLKMYCACFTTRGYCHDGCNCDNCKNSRSNSEQRLEAITTYLVNDPRAFSFASAPQDAGAGFFQLLPEKSSTVVLRGCRCKKSKCLKKYCECFQNGLGCSAHCRCVDCSNDSSESAREQREKNRLDRSTGHAFHAIQVSVTKKPRRNFVQKTVRLRL